ncbi:isoamylase early set domain-containing protein [Arsenicibacter rosenii]|uniref:Glycoside hydrolase n=1 Tax=Arsenicibacter rosenii TaxID=1750698 RepID=A0A1S2VMS2_9BACT|nr:isoamylase early set domain-containing protein [Arsenicibacter rosenii]OIN60071.1 glycoside hydrolase [Arsenicibacter rosenii]
MALAKQFLKSKPVCKVTFSVTPETINGAKSVALVGEFNEWNAEAAPLKKQKDGSYKTTVELPVGSEYQFRYLIDGEQWLNDDTADKYVNSGVSAEDNCVVVL